MIGRGDQEGPLLLPLEESLDLLKKVNQSLGLWKESPSEYESDSYTDKQRHELYS